MTKTNKPIKLSFKKHKKPSGLMGVGYGWYVDVRIKGQKIGTLRGGQARSNTVTIQVAFKKERTPENPAPFYWIFIENNCKTEEEARARVQEVIDEVSQGKEFHFFED